MSMDSTEADGVRAKGEPNGSENMHAGEDGRERSDDETAAGGEPNMRPLARVEYPPTPTYDLVLAPATTHARRRLAYIGAAVGAGLAVGYLFGSSAGLRKSAQTGAPEAAASVTQALPWKSVLSSAVVEKRETAQLAESIRAIRTQLEQLRRGVDSSRANERFRALESARDENRDAAKASAARIEKLETRLSQLERASADRTPTGSLPKDRAAKSNEARADAKALLQDQKAAGAQKPISTYALRDVYRGIAIVERRDGLVEEVSRGDELPGAGRVTAIERRGDGWVVVTTKGVIDRRPY